MSLRGVKFELESMSKQFKAFSDGS